MIPEHLSWQGLYAVGAIVLAIGLVVAAAGILIRRRLEEDHRDERYVREHRGEEVAQVESPRVARLLQYAGVAIVLVGIVALVAGWTVAPGQS
jgi:hypothetical protein